jgi:hypothetical protein
MQGYASDITASERPARDQVNIVSFGGKIFYPSLSMNIARVAEKKHLQLLFSLSSNHRY